MSKPSILATSTIRSQSRNRYGPSKMDLHFAELRDAAPTIIRCAQCRGKVIAQGPFGEARLQAEQHRTELHGWKRKKRRKR